MYPGIDRIGDQILTPYSTLENSDRGPLMREGPLFAFDNLVNSIDRLPHQRVLSGAFRANLKTEYDLPTGIDFPWQTPERCRSENWNMLCEYEQRFPTLSLEQQNRFLQTLIYLGFYAA